MIESLLASSGEIIMMVPVPPNGVASGWVDLGNGNMGAPMTRFLQRDIDEGRIWYKNKGTAALTEIIKFEVSMQRKVTISGMNVKIRNINLTKN